MGPGTRRLKAAYVVSASAHRADNAAGRNHWNVYTREILDQLGLPAEPVDAEAMSVEMLHGLSMLILPGPAHTWLSAEALQGLGDWVVGGGTLIGFGCEGLDDLFGVRATGEVLPQADEFAAAGGMKWCRHPLSEGVIWPLHPDAPGPILSPIRACVSDGADVLAEVTGTNAMAAACVRHVGDGLCVYFAFDLAHHMWVAHHGRPVDADYDGDGYFRLSDAIPAREFEPELPHADQIIFFLRNVAGRTGHPLISAIPPMPLTGEPADVLLFWGGDGEAAEGTQVPASDFMHELGLPYHLNLMPDKEGRFVVSREQFEAIKANGHELSVHYDFQTGYEHPYAFTEKEILQQAEWYERAFGERAACSVFHCTHWTGWSEPAEWMLEAGGRADNSRVHRGSPPINPTNMLGYAFGTSFPYHFYRDHRGGNTRLEFLSEPITLYECGYDGATDGTESTQLHAGLEMGLRHHLTVNMFYHPINIAQHESCRQAVRETLRWLDQHNATARHMGNDELADWWFARSRSALTEVTASETKTTFTVECDWHDGCVVQVPLVGIVASVESAGGDLPWKIQDEPWGRWLWISCPLGAGTVDVIWE